MYIDNNNAKAILRNLKFLIRQIAFSDYNPKKLTIARLQEVARLILTNKQHILV